jgi:hypothetical protein
VQIAVTQVIGQDQHDVGALSRLTGDSERQNASDQYQAEK